MRFTITLPDSVAEKLSADVTDQGSPRSTLIARYIEQHYEAAGHPVVDCKAELKKLKTKHEDEVRQINEANDAEHTKIRDSYADVMQRAREEHDGKVQRITDEYKEKVRQIVEGHKAEMQQLRAECDKRADEAKQLEGDVERLEGIMNKLDSELKASEASKNTVVAGLQHKIDGLEKDKSRLEDALQDAKVNLRKEEGRYEQQRHDLDHLQKQLELVTRRLPAPKEKRSWWNPFRRKPQEPPQE